MPSNRRQKEVKSKWIDGADTGEGGNWPLEEQFPDFIFNNVIQANVKLSLSGQFPLYYGSY